MISKRIVVNLNDIVKLVPGAIAIGAGSKWLLTASKPEIAVASLASYVLGGGKLPSTDQINGWLDKLTNQFNKVTDGFSLSKQLTGTSM